MMERGNRMAGDTLGVLIVGSGMAAGIHCRHYPHIPGVAVRAFADVVVEQAQKRAAEYGLHGSGTWYQQFEEALVRPDIQVVDICAPAALHGEIALAAIAAGKHVLVEKPMAQTLAEADRMIQAAQRRGVVLGQVFQNRFHRTPRRIKALLESGHLGPLVRARVYGTTIHAYDTLLWLLGDPVRVYAEWPPREGDPQWSELAWSAVARFADGTVGVLQSGRDNTSLPQTFPFQRDSVVLELVGQRLAVVFTIWDQHVQFRAGPDHGGAREADHLADVQRWFDALYPEIPDRHGHRALLEDFFAALRGEHQPTVTGEEGRRTVQLYAGIYKSARDGAPCPFPIAADDAAYGERIGRVPD
jgi:predicted dehydrogenase